MNFPKKFIRATDEFTTLEKGVPAPYFRKEFSSLPGSKASIIITACGFYELYLNGVNITKGHMAPYISNPEHYVYYDKYDVVLDGRNAVGVLLGNGFCNNPGGYIWDFDKASYRQAPKFAMKIEYLNSNGESAVTHSDTDFKTAPSPIIFDDYRFGEHYDANLEIDKWNTVGFDDSNWDYAKTAPVPLGEAKLCEAEPIRKQYEIKPERIFEHNGMYIYDFGKNCAGVCRLKISGEKGQKVELLHFEEMLDGEIELKTVWFPNCWERDKDIVHRDIYILKGDAEETYTPRFTYHGFRMVAVSGITPEQATEELLIYVVMNSDVKICGGFSTSDSILNTLQEFTLRSDLSNLHYFPTDCPQREKNGWTADAAISSEQLLLNLTVQNCFTEWMRNVVKAQDKRGALPGIVPTGGWGMEWGNGPAWDSVIAFLPYYTYIYRGETRMINESADCFIKYLNYLEMRKDEKGLLEIGLGDWAYVGKECGHFKTPLIVTDSIMAMDVANKISFLFKVVGREKDSEFAKKIADTYRNAIRDNLIDFNDFTVFGKCQTSQAMAIYYGVFEPDEKPSAFKRLKDFIKESNNRMDLGVLGGRVIFHVLSEFGETDLALDMITAPGFPSYAYLIECGATSLWEFFNLDLRGCSKNHHFWGDISAWFIKWLAGLRYNPSKNNLREVDICPLFPQRLNDASAYFESNYGRIETDWERVENGIRISVKIPSDFTGEIRLPAGYLFDDGSSEKSVKSGSYNIVKAKE